MIHTVKIEKIIAGGFGLGRMGNGQVVMTRHVLPGEKVRVREKIRRKGYIEAEPVEIIDAAPQRISPQCPYSPACGGCDFQHIQPPYQHHIKREIVRESLSRASVGINDSIIHPTLPSPHTLHYRHRIRLKVDRNGQMGFFRSGSNELIPVSRCLLATEILNEALLELNRSALLRESAADIAEIELQHSPADDRIFTILHLQRGGNPPKKRIDALYSAFHTINNLLIKKDKKLIPAGSSSPAVLIQDIDNVRGVQSCRLSWSPGCFFQVNVPQCLTLISLVLQMYRQSGGGNVLELYCGMGTFSIPLALQGARITGIEQNPESIRWAKFNARQSGLDQCTFRTGDVGHTVRNLAGRDDRFDIILLDPPRRGLGKAAASILRMAPGNIIYISCDPATLARDLATLTGGGYSLIHLTPVDMFPQTHHIETVALLEKN